MGFDDCFPDHGCKKEFPKGNPKLSAHDPSKVKERIWHLKQENLHKKIKVGYMQEEFQIK